MEDDAESTGSNSPGLVIPNFLMVNSNPNDHVIVRELFRAYFNDHQDEFARRIDGVYFVAALSYQQAENIIVAGQVFNAFLAEELLVASNLRVMLGPQPPIFGLSRLLGLPVEQAFLSVGANGYFHWPPSNHTIQIIFTDAIDHML